LFLGRFRAVNRCDLFPPLGYLARSANTPEKSIDGIR